MEFSKLSRAEKMAMAEAKQSAILTFLASGEVYTTFDILKLLLGRSESTVRRTIEVMLKEKLIRLESLEVGSKKTVLIGITEHGVAMADRAGLCPNYILGRTNPAYVTHHVMTQKTRIKAVKAGATEWLPGRALRNKSYLKVPDALYKIGDKTVGVEVERHLKSPKRYADVVANHLQEMSKKSWSEVHYLLPPLAVPKIQKIFNELGTVTVKGTVVKLEQKHLDRFKFYSFDEYLSSN
ncbi:MAG: hypothetical protein PHP57_06415 [Sideroxydans sp.]|nr:hypothetical protein [Sideroxydans sp.]